MEKKKIKMTKLEKVEREKIGRIVENDVILEPHEYRTVLFLAQLGFDIELVRPSNIPKSKNPDIEMLGTFWEMKGPTKYNEDTIKLRFQKAKKQADGKAVFDLRNVRGRVNEVEEYILELFATSRGMHRIIIIKNNDGAIDFRK